MGAVNHRTQEKKGDGCHRSGYHRERGRGTVSLQVIQRTGMKSNYILQTLRGVGANWHLKQLVLSGQLLHKGHVTLQNCKIDSLPLAFPPPLCLSAAWIGHRQQGNEVDSPFGLCEKHVRSGHCVLAWNSCSQRPIIWMWSVILEVSPCSAYTMAVLTRELLRTLRHLAVRDQDSPRAPHSLWNGTSWSHLALDRSNSSELFGLFAGLNQRACVEHSRRSGIWEGFDETINIVKNLRLSATEIHFLCRRHRYNARSSPIS